MAPNKKYLSLEEAAVQLAIKPDELIRLREKGEVRGFADRGTWKFKADDIAEYRRRLQPDSDPDLAIMDDSDDSKPVGSQKPSTGSADGMSSDSDVRLVLSDEPKKKKLAGSSAEVPAVDLLKSDSDVRLVEPPKRPKIDSDSDVKIVKPKAAKKTDSDSDVKMVDSHLPDSDSDVRMVDSIEESDSDVKLLPTDVSLIDSDSDVRLAASFQSDSDVKLIRKKSKPGVPDSDSDVMLLPRGSRGGTPVDFAGKLEKAPLDSGIGGIDFDLGRTDKDVPILDDSHDSSIPLGADSGIRLAGESGIQLSGDSGIQLSGDSGIQLPDDSGIQLGGDSGIRLGGDSGIRLSEDSGVQLMQPADSGISLEGMDSAIRFADSGLALGDDSGINLASPSSGDNLRKKKKGGSSKNLKGGSSKNLRGSAEDDIESTSPMLMPDLDDDFDNPMTAPMLSAADSDEAHSLAMDPYETSDTSEMQQLGESGADVIVFEDEEDDEPPVSQKRKQKSVADQLFESQEGEEVLEELEVSDEDLSGNEFEDLGFEDSAEDLGDSFSEGSSQFELTTPRKMAVAREVEWSAGFCSLLVASLSVSIVGALVSADLLRVVWAQGQDSTVEPGIAWLLAGFWK